MSTVPREPHEPDEPGEPIPLTPKRADASMTLITTMLERPLDPGYQEAADRRTDKGQPAATSTRTAIVVLMAILTGFLFAVAAQSLRPKPTAAAAVKTELVTRIETLQKTGTTQEASIAALTREVRDLEAQALAQAGGTDLTGEINALELQAGAVALTGPGLTVTIDDAPTADGNADAGNRPSGGFESGSVSSGDLQIIVNGLWQAGAEAIAVNGHRLTSTSAIRFAGQAIIVDFRPLTRPYVLTAIGDADAMQARFEPSFAGVYLAQLTKQYGIISTLAAGDALAVPADSGGRLLDAEPLGTLPSNAPAPPASTATTPASDTSGTTSRTGAP